MYYTPYFKSKGHKFCFISFFVTLFISNALFIASIIAAFNSKTDSLQDDPVANGIMIALVAAILITIFFFIIFTVDLIMFFIAKGRAKKNKGAPIYIETNKEQSKEQQEETVSSAIGNLSVHLNEKSDNSLDVEYEFKEKHNPTFKKTLLLQGYTSASGLLFIWVLGTVVIFIVGLLTNMKNLLIGVIAAAIMSGALLIFFTLLFFLIVLVLNNHQKKLKPIDLGTRIYPDYLESYTVLNQDLNNQHLDMTISTKAPFDKLKYFETKEYLFCKAIVNKQLVAFTFDKKDVPEEAIILIKNKIKKVVVQKQCVPTVEDMSKEDFDTEMKESLKRMKNGEGKNIDEVFDEIRTKNK